MKDTEKCGSKDMPFSENCFLGQGRLQGLKSLVWQIPSHKRLSEILRTRNHLLNLFDSEPTQTDNIDRLFKRKWKLFSFLPLLKNFLKSIKSNFRLEFFLKKKKKMEKNTSFYFLLFFSYFTSVFKKMLPCLL